MKKTYSQIFTFGLFILVSTVAFGTSSRDRTKSIWSDFSISNDLNIGYKSNFEALDLSSFLGSQASFSKSLGDDVEINSVGKDFANRAVVACPGDLGPFIADLGTCGTIVNYVPPTSDIALIGTMELMTALGTGNSFPVGITTVTYEEHSSGVPNGNFCTFYVTVLDGEDPTASNPVDISVQCRSNVPAADITVVIDEADNCGTPTVTYVGDSANPAINNGTIVRTYRVDDSNGNSIEVKQNIIIDDTIKPIKPDLADINVGQCSGTPPTPSTTDECAGTLLGTTSTSFPITSQGITVVTWTFIDGNGNLVKANQNVIVDDTTNPTTPTLADVNVGQCSGTPPTPTTTDACAGTISGTTSTTFPITTQGITVVTWNFDDGNGNVINVDQNVIVDDTIAPIAKVTNLPIKTGQCSVTVTAPKATDNCQGTIVGTTTDPTIYTTQGTYTINWVYDDTNGNTSTQTQIVTIEDTKAPNPRVSPLAPIVGQCFATVTTIPKANDNCNGTIYGTTTDPTSFTTQGTYTINWLYDDTYGNTSTQTQTVIIKDTKAPVPNTINLPTITGQCSATVTAPLATDNCKGAITGTTSDPTSYTAQGTYFITWTYDDTLGNISTQSQTVIVKDTQNPVTPTLPNLSAECSLTVTPPTTIDNCTGTITGITGLSSLTFDTVGTDIIYWEFTDVVGNSIIVPQNITITDAAPVPNISVLAPQVFNGCQIVNINSLVAPKATDICDGAIVGTLSPNFVFPYSFSGTQTIDWEFIDSHGNVRIQSQDITLNPLPIAGGTIKGTFQSTVFSDGIDISSCNVAISIALNLNDEIGTIIRWEKFAVNHGVWEAISDSDDSYTASFAIGALESTYYRVLIQTGTCSAYSNQFLIRALPVGSAPAITNLDPDALYCLGEEVSLLATSTYTATQETIPDSSGDFNQGQLNTQDPNGWLVDGDPGGFTAGGSSTKPRNWSAKTCNNQPNGSIIYCSNEGKYSIAYGDYSSNQYKGAIPTTFETPILDFSNAETASLDFDQAFYFANNDYANIEISTNGGVTYSPLRLMHAPGTGIKKWFTAGTAESLVGSDATHYNFQTDNTSINLSAYLGQTNIRIKWSFKGTTVDSTWALDNIFVNKRVVVDTELEWTDGIGNPNVPPIADGTTEVAFVFEPDAPGHHQYGTTALINNCRTYDVDGTALIDIYVSHAYAGENVTYLSQECGRNTVQLNAYDNRKTARANANKGAFTLPVNCVNCDDAGTGDDGVWSIAANSACGGGTFSNPNDPDAIFTAEAGTYTLNWTVAGCNSSITVTTTNCTQIDFDGTNDYVDFGNINFGINSDAFSIEAWVKPEVLSGTQTIFSKRNNNGSNAGYDLSLDDSGIVSFNINRSATINSSPHRINTNRWYHIAVTYLSGRYSLYIDGLLINSNAGTLPNSNIFKALLGAMDDNSSNNGPKKYFNGWIDEFRVWNVGLTPDQIHQMMNQRIVPSPTVAGNVQGEIIPADVNGLTWSNLTAYFQMDPSKVACGYLQSTSSSIKGKLKNISSNQTRTAPIPYTSAVDGPWDADNTWKYPAVWDAPNSVGINGSRIDWNIVRTNHNIVSSARDVTLLGLIVNTNKLTITGPGVQDETNPGTGLWVTHYLKLLGNMDLVGESQLVQKRYIASQFNDSFLDSESTGFLKRDQQGTADKFTYNYWSSPVGIRNATTNNNSYRVKDVMKDGVNNINWITSGYNGTNTNPVGIADYWIWKFANRQDDNYSLWQHVRSTGSMLAGEGFTMKGPGTGPISANQNYVFTGKPNNGNINLTLAGGNDYLVGNPYPSAMDGVQFIVDNGPVIAGNEPGITGTLYFWEHWGGGSHNLADYQGGYATFNLSGGAPSAAKGSSDPDVGTGGIPTKTPGRYIPVSQGFFVVAEGSGGTIKFNNGQRIFARENANSVFLRPAEGASTTNYAPDGEDPRMKFRIGFNSTNTIHRQLLLTVDENASEGIDWGYDALNIDDQIDDMFWMIGGGKYNIQGTDVVNTTTIFPLGFHLKNAGQNTISIDHLENVPDAMEIYVHDILANSYHNLRQSAFSFMLPGGDFMDRYEITFQDPTALGLPDTDLSQLDIHYTIDLESLVLINPTLQTVKSIELFNILGQSVYSTKKIENASYSEYKVKNLSTGTYIVKLITETGSISKKVLVK